MSWLYSIALRRQASVAPGQQRCIIRVGEAAYAGNWARARIVPELV
ncbi:MAG: hypothetical protein WBW99_07845 [Pseudolabrys sp.]